MSDHHTTINLLGVEVPVTVSWRVTSYSDGGELEIEGVFSDVLGEITDRVCNSVVGTGFTVGRVLDSGWQDPIRRVLFGQCAAYNVGDKRLRPEAQPSRFGVGRWLEQHEATKAQIGIDGTLYALLYDEIFDSDAFALALGEGPGDDEGDWY